MPLKYKSRTRIPRTAAVDWDSIIDELNASGKSSCLCNSESREHAIVYCNDAFCTLTGYLKSEIVQQNATGQFLAGPLTDEATLQEIEHALSHKKAIKVDVLLYQADGTPYWSLVKTETVVKRDRSRDETFMIVTHEDITASKLKRSHSNQFLGKFNKAESFFEIRLHWETRSGVPCFLWTKIYMRAPLAFRKTHASVGCDCQ
eukprot:m.225573 g.225573  ORF g.225573 m.225573 type:complete len:203 (+) comp40016_c0_seq16:282-890(+)